MQQQTMSRPGDPVPCHGKKSFAGVSGPGAYLPSFDHQLALFDVALDAL
jgi:hypothetical protein